VAFLQKGNGKDLVFLHGYMANKESFALQTQYFSRYYRVTAIDFLGFGKSGAIPFAYSVGDYADWTKDVLENLGVVRPHVIAHSFGCRVAVKLGAKYTGFWDKMVLTGPAGVVLPRGLGYKIKVGAYRLCRKFAPTFAEKRFGSKEYRALSPLMKESYKKIVNEDLRAIAAGIANAVLIIEGERDEVTPMKEARAYCDVMQNARLTTIDGGHFAFAENPVAFNILVEEFLQNA
jgi:pimeloyl-ACP methyl ester carboxylesterase